ncbi:MAG: GNAT family N-acetyltransferase [Acidobacteriota bacterium]
MRLVARDDIRPILRRDRYWCLYALGDLTPRMFEKCAWFTPDLSLVLHDFGTCILFAMGTGSLDEALAHVTFPVHLQLQQDALAHVARVVSIDRQLPMWRMAWTGGPLPPADGRAVRLRAGDVEAVRRLYADGDATGEAPDFFYPEMIGDGVFYGVYDGGDLASVAGTHLVARDEGAAAIGNIYTRRDCRNRGLGRLVTTAVLRELQGIETIGLNVRADNAAAIQLYESLGFARHCRFFEALASGAIGA